MPAGLLHISGGSREESVSLPLPVSGGWLYSLGHRPFFHFQNHQCIIYKSPSHYDFLLSSLKDPHNYMEPLQIIQNSLPNSGCLT